MFQCCLFRKGKPKTDQIDQSQFIQMKGTSIKQDWRGYKIIIFQGSCGQVFKAIRKCNGMIRAVKIIPKHIVNYNRMNQELTILRQLDHPNIITIHEMYQDDQSYYIVMEYLDGGELFDKIIKNASFSEQEAAKYAQQILLAVSYCHQKGIVHGDLKPENILFNKQNELKVIDFGSSNKINLKNEIDMGTINYASPERFQGTLTEKSDIWSFGVILYILLTGKAPFNGFSEQEIQNKILTPLEYDEDTWKSISIEGRQLVQSILQIDSHSRPTAQQLLQNNWIKDNNYKDILNPEHLQQIQEFQCSNRIRKALKLFISSQIISNRDRQTLLNTFRNMDTNSDGILSRKELIEGYKKIWPHRQDIENLVDQIMIQVDLNHSGTIEYSEFILASINMEQLNQRKELEQAFKIIDIDGNGQLSREELSNILGGISVDDIQWESFLNECDEDKNGQISYDEFINLLIKKY